MGFEELASENVSGKTVEFWKDSGRGVDAKHDYKIRIPISKRVTEKYYLEANNKEEVLNELRFGGVIQDEWGNMYSVEPEDDMFKVTPL